MHLKSIDAIYRDKDKKKGRKYLSQLIFNNKRSIKLIRVGCEVSHDGTAKRLNTRNKNTFLNSKGKKVKLQKAKITNFALFNPKGRKNVKKKLQLANGHSFNKFTLVNDGGKKSLMRGIHENHKLRDILGYYPHIYYKDHWRPLFYMVDKKISLIPEWDKHNKKFYDFPFENIISVKFFCYTRRSNQAKRPAGNKKIWDVQTLLDNYWGRRQT
tara:strand:+ start:1569 stop:2207 length:639 start_codon:yes stop_codon:yes gene_type:complete